MWLILAGPWAVTVARYAAGATFYGEFIHVTGELSARLLILALAATPLRLMFPGRAWTGWLVKNRRYFGVAAFAYAVPHLAAYILRLEPARIASEALEAGMLTGWAAFAILLALAVTSNNASVRRLGRRWKSLHRLVYAGAVLTFAHWILTAFDPAAGIIHATVPAALESYRLWKTRLPSVRPSPR